MANSQFERIKNLTIIALVSDDELMAKLVLKGGNALSLVLPRSARQSLDLDFSVDGDLGSIHELNAKLSRLLQGTFGTYGFMVFDVKLTKAPPNLREDKLGAFWGGYKLEFKVIAKDVYDSFGGTPDKRRLQSLELGPGGKRTFTVDFSNHEHVAGKIERDLEGFTVYVYSALMIACEKVRAICQQMPEYREIVMSDSRRPRARDFFDIHQLVTTGGVDFSSAEAANTLLHMFRVKRVPLTLISRISAEREFHRENFESLKATVAHSIDLRDFDFYVDFLADKLRSLESRWVIEPPVG